MSLKVDELLEVTIVSVHAADKIYQFLRLQVAGIVRYDSCRLNFATIMITCLRLLPWNDYLWVIPMWFIFYVSCHYGSKETVKSESKVFTLQYSWEIARTWSQTISNPNSITLMLFWSWTGPRLVADGPNLPMIPTSALNSFADIFVRKFITNRY